VNTWSYKAVSTSACCPGSVAGRYRHGRGPGKGHRRSGAVGGYKELSKYTELGGQLTVVCAAAVSSDASSQYRRAEPGSRAFLCAAAGAHIWRVKVPCMAASAIRMRMLQLRH